MIDWVNFKVYDVLTWKTITTNTLPNISRSKYNETMNFGQFMEYSKRNIFFKNHAENEARRLVTDFFSFLKKALYDMKTSGL